MNAYSFSLKHFFGTVALITASVFCIQAIAEDQTYTCSARAKLKSAPSGSPSERNFDIQASSAEDAKSKLLAQYAGSSIDIVRVKSCKLKG